MSFKTSGIANKLGFLKNENHSNNFPQIQWLLYTQSKNYQSLINIMAVTYENVKKSCSSREAIITYFPIYPHMQRDKTTLYLYDTCTLPQFVFLLFFLKRPHRRFRPKLMPHPNPTLSHVVVGERWIVRCGASKLRR